MEHGILRSFISHECCTCMRLLLAIGFGGKFVEVTNPENRIYNLVLVPSSSSWERESRVEKREKVLVIFVLCNHHLFFVAFDLNISAWFLNECRHQHMVLNHLHLVFLFLICFDYWSEYCVSESWLINLAFWNRTGSWGEFDQLYKGQVHNTNL